MTKLRVLHVCHNHPALRAGGAETYALELYEEMRARDGYEPILLARAGPPMSAGAAPPRDGLIGSLRDDPNQYLLYTDGGRFDRLRGVQLDESIAEAFERFLMDVRPDVVHFQHTLFLGYDLLTTARRALPHVPIVYTLHDYIPICHRWGQMLRADGTLCRAASPEQCHNCFPDIPEEDFAARTEFVRSQLGAVDLFIAPSPFLRDRFVEWGVPGSKIVVEDYGRAAMAPLVEPGSMHRHRRNRLGFFGQMTHFKGINVLLEAMALLRQRGVDAELRVHGANLDVAPAAVRNRFRELLASVGDSVVYPGEYGRGDLRQLMRDVDWVVVPSLWWENSPLVIQEAFAHGRPVICSGIGGMAEKVDDGVNGLHFAVGDPFALAETIERALNAPDLWNTLCSGIRPVHAMGDHLRLLDSHYRRLLAARPGLAA